MLLAVDSATLISSESESHVVVVESAKVAEEEKEKVLAGVAECCDGTPSSCDVAVASSSVPDVATKGVDAERNLDQVRDGIETRMRLANMLVSGEFLYREYYSYL